MKGNDFIVHTIPEFLTVVSGIKESEEVCWFRGHKDARYKLAPNLYRKDELERTEDGPLVCSLNTDRGAIRFKFKKDHAAAFEMFKKDALAFVSQKPVNDFEWLVLFQHYGGNTQLLDWTTNLLISLYFATNNLKNTAKISRKSIQIGDAHEIMRFLRQPRKGRVLSQSPPPFSRLC